MKWSFYNHALIMLIRISTKLVPIALKQVYITQGAIMKKQKVNVKEKPCWVFETVHQEKTLERLKIMD